MDKYYIQDKNLMKYILNYISVTTDLNILKAVNKISKDFNISLDIFCTEDIAESIYNKDMEKACRLACKYKLLNLAKYLMEEDENELIIDYIAAYDFIEFIEEFGIIIGDNILDIAIRNNSVNIVNDVIINGDYKIHHDILYKSLSLGSDIISEMIITNIEVDNRYYFSLACTKSSPRIIKILLNYTNDDNNRIIVNGMINAIKDKNNRVFLYLCCEVPSLIKQYNGVFADYAIDYGNKEILDILDQ